MASPQYRETIEESEIILTEAARGQLATLCGQIDDDEVEAVRIYVTGEDAPA